MMVHAGILLQILNIDKHVLFLNRQEIFAAGRQKTYNQSYFIQSVNKIKDTFEAFNFCAVCFYFYYFMNENSCNKFLIHIILTFNNHKI